MVTIGGGIGFCAIALVQCSQRTRSKLAAIGDGSTNVRPLIDGKSGDDDDDMRSAIAEARKEAAPDPTTVVGPADARGEDLYSKSAPPAGRGTAPPAAAARSQWAHDGQWAAGARV
eukprot:gene11543-52150_t